MLKKKTGPVSVVDQFEKRERPKVIASGHRDAIIDCLYKNTNTKDVQYSNLFYLFYLISFF